VNGTIISIVIVYLLICLLIGIWATRKTKTTSDFLVAGKSLGMFVMAIAAFSSIQSGFGMLGGTGLTYAGGMGFIAGVGIAAPLGFGLTWFLVGKRMRKVGDLGEIYTLGDIVEKRYESKAVRGWIGLALTLGVIGYLGTQVQAMGVIMNTVFGVSPNIGAIIGLAILAFYCVGGGIIAGVYTDLFQGIIMVTVSVVIFFMAINIGGGVQNMTETLQSSDPLMASPFGTYSLLSIACWIFLFSFGAAGQPHFITKFLMIKDQKQLKWGAFTAGGAYALSTLLVIGIGLSAKALSLKGQFPKISSPDEALTVFITHFTSPIIGGLVIAGLLAAIMSTGSSFVTLGASSLIRDIPQAFNIKVKNELLLTRIAVLGLLILSLLFSFYMNTLVALLGVFGWGTFASAVFPAVVLGLIWKKATKYGAISSIIIGLVLNFALEIGGKYGVVILPKGVIVGAFSFAVSIIIFIAVSLMTQKASVKLDQDLLEAMEG
jgi:sodium/proline symporter